MKKSTLIMACCIGLMLFASCKKDPVAPTISIFNGSGYATENSAYYSGDEINVGFVATGENLTKLEATVSQNGTVLTTHFENIEKEATYTYSHTFTIEASGTITITGTITDAAGQTATTSFNIICNEKPNEKFVGHYEGEALFTGTMEATVSGMEPMQQEVNDRPISVTVDLRAGETVNEVVGTCKTEGQEMEIKGTVDGNTVTFEAANTTVTLNYDLGGFSLQPAVDMTYNVKATLENEKLAIDGNCTGEGEIHMLFYNGTIAIDGLLGGSLNKVR